jgi:hypothetical protein
MILSISSDWLIHQKQYRWIVKVFFANSIRILQPPEKVLFTVVKKTPLWKPRPKDFLGKMLKHNYHQVVFKRLHYSQDKIFDYFRIFK